MKRVEDRSLEEKRQWIDRIMVLVGYDYLDPQWEEDLINKGLEELIPIAHEVQRIKSQLIDPLNKQLKELGYDHEIDIRTFVDGAWLI